MGFNIGNAFNSGLGVALPVIGGVAGAYLGGPMGAMYGAQMGSSVYGAYQNYLNYDLQRDQLNYQKRLQNEIFAREDNAVSRRMNDLMSAGLSPTLAAGSSAGAGAVVATHAPQYGDMKADPMAVMALMKMGNDIETSKVQRDLIRAQINTQRAEGAIKWNDFSIFANTNTPSNAGALNAIRALISGAKLDEIPADIQNIYDTTKEKVQKGNIFNLPKLSPDQVLKLQQQYNKQYGGHK